MLQPIFVTSNVHKAAYLARQLDISLEHRSIDLEEIQSVDLHEIVAHKLRQAYEVMQQPVLVEDVSLVFKALGKLPGPYIKWFLEYCGPEVCCRLLDGFDDKAAVIACTFGYYDGKQMKFFDSEMHGTISDKPRGNSGYGFDSIFIMDGYTKTRAELPQEEVERTYAEQMKPFAAVREFLTK